MNESDASLSGLLPASKAELQSTNAKLMAIIAKQNTRINELEFRFDHAEVSALSGKSAVALNWVLRQFCRPYNELYLCDPDYYRSDRSWHNWRERYSPIWHVLPVSFTYIS